MAPRGSNILHLRWTHPCSTARGFGHFCNQSDSRPEELGLAAGAITMKPFIWGGILFIVLGGFALAYQGFNYTHQEKVLDIGPIHATADKNEHVYISPLLGALALMGGIVLLTVGMRHKLSST